MVQIVLDEEDSPITVRQKTTKSRNNFLKDSDSDVEQIQDVDSETDEIVSTPVLKSRDPR
jgi:hypothetical protein